MTSKALKRVGTQIGVKTLEQHNAEVGSAGVACDKCGAGMNYDRDKQRYERQQERQAYPSPTRDGEPVYCPKCSHTGRLLSRIY